MNKGIQVTVSYHENEVSFHIHRDGSVLTLSLDEVDILSDLLRLRV